jgi:hypothetical protein
MTNPAASNPDETLTAASITEPQTAKTEGSRGEVSAQTIARMMGLTTQSDMKLIEGKLDLLVSRLGTISVRLDKVTTLLQQVPTGNDMERVDVQIGTLRSSMRELLSALKGNASVSNPDSKNLMDKAEKELDSLPEGFEQK